ncbi:MAG: hypothetical protein KBT35_02855 [Firmicutes bacterium]|nr:hypothetical protein [Candidatus Colivicinus equi]
MNKEKISYDKLVDTVIRIEPSKRLEYLSNFFVSKNSKNYEVDKNNPLPYKLVLKYLFSSHIDIEERAYKAIDKYVFCYEAVFIISMISDGAYANSYFKYYYKLKDDYPGLSDNEKAAYLKILDLYVEFLIDIGNYTQAQKIEDLLMLLSNISTNKETDRMFYILYMKEDAKEMYKLYCENNDLSIESYILLMITLLKNDEELKTKGVLREFISKYKYGEYLGRIWDLDTNEEDATDFFDIVDSCYDKILSVPDFFATIAEMTNSIINI